MTDYALTGKKGTGKSKHAIILIRDQYLKEGRSVASNLDINLSKLLGPQSRSTYVRVPDKPRSFDLLAVGHGNPDSYDEEKNGGMFLDELGTWLNTRTFGDKDRAAVLDYFAHGRKFGFDIWYIMQNVTQVDKQVREAFIEQTVRHTRFDKVRIPFVGGILSALFGKRAGFMPKFHVAVYRMGVNPQDMVTNRATFIGKEVEQAYDTRQVFQENYPHGTHSVLSPWHLEGRFMAPVRSGFWSRLFDFSGAASGAVVRQRGVVGVDSVAVRAADLARRLPVGDRVRFVNRYTKACAALAHRSVQVTRDGVR